MALGGFYGLLLEKIKPKKVSIFKSTKVSMTLSKRILHTNLLNLLVISMN